VLILIIFLPHRIPNIHPQWYATGYFIFTFLLRQKRTPAIWRDLRQKRRPEIDIQPDFWMARYSAFVLL
jgi:hypothetical protein